MKNNMVLFLASNLVSLVVMTIVVVWVWNRSELQLTEHRRLLSNSVVAVS